MSQLQRAIDGVGEPGGAVRLVLAILSDPGIKEIMEKAVAHLPADKQPAVRAELENLPGQIATINSVANTVIGCFGKRAAK